MTPMPTLPELPKPGFPMMRQKIDGNYLTGEIAGYFTADQMREYALAALATRAQEPLKVSASTERVWRAIYERICFAGEPVADVLADYEDTLATRQGEAVAWKVIGDGATKCVFFEDDATYLAERGCTIVPLFAAPVASESKGFDYAELERALCAITVVGKALGRDVILRDSVIEIVRDRIAMQPPAMQGKGDE